MSSKVESGTTGVRSCETTGGKREKIRAFKKVKRQKNTD